MKNLPDIDRMPLGRSILKNCGANASCVNCYVTLSINLPFFHGHSQVTRLPNNRIKAADLTEETLRQILALGAQLERQAMRALPQDAMLAGGETLQHVPCGPSCPIRCTASCWRAFRRPTLPLP